MATAKRKLKQSLVIGLKTGGSIEIFFDRVPRHFGFASLENIKSVYATIDYQASKTKQEKPQ